MMSAQVFRTCPSSEMPWERWSGLPYEVQKNKFHPLQAYQNRLPLSRSHWHASHPPPHAKQIPNPRGDQTKDQAQFSFTPRSTKYLTTNSPNVEKEISCFPCLSFLSIALQLAMRNSNRKNNVFSYYLTDIYWTVTMCQVLWGILATVTKWHLLNS